MELLQPLLQLVNYKVEAAIWVGISMALYALGVDISWQEPSKSGLIVAGS